MNQNEEQIERLKVLRFVREKEKLNPLYVIAEGRGKELAELNGTIDQARRIKVGKLEIEDNQIRDTLYINAKGDVLTECDLSYRRQDKNKIGNVMEKKIVEMVNNDKKEYK